MSHERESRPDGSTTETASQTYPRQRDQVDTEFTMRRPQDGYAAPTAEDRREAAVLAEAAELGYRLATTCVDCGHWISSPSSIAVSRGPVCRARAQKAAVEL